MRRLCSHDPTDDNLVKAFGELPSFYQGRFVPEVMET